MKKHALAMTLALVVGMPAGAILTMAMTPLLWDLEKPLQMELAGHSGPSDWVFYVVWAVVIPALFVLFRYTVFRDRAKPQ